MASGDFADKIKDIENRLLQLKTASEYSSVRTAQYTTTAAVSTGLYRVTFASSNDEIFSTFYCYESGGNYGFAYARTPSGNTQIVEILTDKVTSQGWVTVQIPLTIVSNIPVESVVRIN